MALIAAGLVVGWQRAWASQGLAVPGRELQVPQVPQLLRSAHDTSFPLNSSWCQSSILQGFF